ISSNPRLLYLAGMSFAPFQNNGSLHVVTSPHVFMHVDLKEGIIMLHLFAGRRRRRRSRTQSTLALAIMVAVFGLNVTAPSARAQNSGDGKFIFRFDTYGDERQWTTRLQMHRVIESSLNPLTALQLGLRVDSDALP